MRSACRASVVAALVWLLIRVLTLFAVRDINAILWWDEDGVLIGTFLYLVDWRDVKDGTWTIQTIRLGLFEV